jgi:hypothetical protein
MNALTRLIEYAREFDGETAELGNEAAAELARLQAIEVAARNVLGSFMVTDVWDDEAGTPAREEAIGDMHRDQRLEALAAALDAK